MTAWEYPRCTVVGVYDGDTCWVDIDLGQDIWVRRRTVRLDGIAARELREPGGPEARDALAALLPEGSVVRIVSRGWDKYGGRIDGVIYLSGGRTVQSLMVSTGWAVWWDGRGAQPKPAWPNPIAQDRR